MISLGSGLLVLSIVIFGCVIYYNTVEYYSISILSLSVSFVFLVFLLIYYNNKRIRRFFYPIKTYQSVFYFLSLVPIVLYLIIYYVDYFMIKRNVFNLYIDLEEVLKHNAIFTGYILTIIVALMAYSRMNANNMKELFDLLLKFLEENQPQNQPQKIYFITPTPFLGYLHYKKYYNLFLYYFTEENIKIEIICLENDMSRIEELKNKLINIKDEWKITLNKSHNLLKNANIIKKKSAAEIDEVASKKAYIEFMENYSSNYDSIDLVRFHLNELNSDDIASDNMKFDYLIRDCPKLCVNDQLQGLTFII